MNNTSSSNGQRSLWRIFRIPCVLGLLSMAGLLSALLGDGLWDGLSWLTLGALPVMMACYIPWWR